MAVWAQARCEACGRASVVAAGGRLGAELVCADCGGPVYVVDENGPVIDGIGLPTVLYPFAGTDGINADVGPEDCEVCADLGELCLFHQGWVAALGGVA